MLRVSMACFIFVALSLSSSTGISMWASKGSRLCRKPSHSVHHVSARKRLYLRALKKSDPVRALRRAIISNNSKEIFSWAAYAGFIFPCGSNAMEMIAEQKIDFKESAHRLFAEHGASPLVPNLISLHTFKTLSPEGPVGDIEHEQWDAYSEALYPILVASRAFLTKSDEEAIRHFKKIYLMVARNAGETAAHTEMIRFVHNGVAFSNSLLTPFYFSPSLESEQILSIQQKFFIKDYRAIAASLLANLGVVKAKNSEAELIASTQRFVGLLAPDYIIHVARVISGLMLNPEVRFLADQPERAFLLLPSNFSDQPMHKIPLPKAHAEAIRIIRRTVKKISIADHD